MADVKSNAQAVQQAECDMYGPIAEAQSLLGLYGTVPPHEMDSWATLAEGCLSRFVGAFEVYQGLVALHGRPANVIPGLKSAIEA